MRHLAYADIKKHTIPFSLSNSTAKVAHFLTTIFGSIYHDRRQKRPPFTKCLIILGGVSQAYITPQGQTEHRIQVERLNQSFNRFIKKLKTQKIDDCFMFMNFLDYYRLDKAVWYDNSGQPRKLIQ